MDVHPSSDVAFTPAVKAIQSLKGSRRAYARLEAQGGFETALTPDLLAFLSEVDTAYLVTASAAGQPYAQHRGGPKGFIRALDATTLAFADYSGNRQYISAGNLSENSKAFLFCMDYAHRRRIKLWGHARVVEGDSALLARLSPESSVARVEQAIVFEVSAWDGNCPQHIPQKLDADEVTSAFHKLQERVTALEARNAQLLAEASAAARRPRGPRQL